MRQESDALWSEKRQKTEKVRNPKKKKSVKKSKKGKKNNSGNNNGGNDKGGNNNGGNNNGGNNNGGNDNGGNNNGGNNQDELPSARLVTSKVFSDLSVEMSEFTLMLMQWGQFIDHDLILTPTNTIAADNGDTLNIDCCDNGQLISPSLLHPECFPISIPADDPLYQPHGKTCMNLVRSLPAANIACTMGPREQMNAITHYLDGSMIYGSSEAELEALRSQTQRWRLKNQGDDLLPEAEDSEECPITNGQACFKAGDLRVNEQTGLTMTHTLWMREHNRIADYLRNQLGSSKTDDDIFQMTRKIVGAEIQHITYNEFLRIILGETYGNAHFLFPDSNNPYYTTYDTDLDPSISNSFGAAAFRFGHSMVQGILKLYNTTAEYKVSLRTQFFNPFEIYQNNFRDDMCRGLTEQPPQKVDGLFAKEIMGGLFQGISEAVGLDLPALNIQRGRDHGLPEYNAYRVLCGLNKVTSFTALANGNSQLAARLNEVYGHIDNVDLFVGGILEPPYQDSLLGPTFLCIVGDQFYRLKNGDRYFYENNHQPEPFSPDQIWEIKNYVGLASIFCQNAGDFTEIPINAFKSGANIGFTPCDQIPKMDLSVFLTM